MKTPPYPVPSRHNTETGFASGRIARFARAPRSVAGIKRPAKKPDDFYTMVMADPGKGVEAPTGPTPGPEGSNESGTQEGRVVLGNALSRKAGDVGAMVARRWKERLPPGAFDSDPAEQEVVHKNIVRTTTLATESVAHFLLTGELPTADQARTLYSWGKAPLRSAISLADLTKLYLNWRDVAMEVARDEARATKVQTKALDEALAVISAGSDGAMVRMARHFDSEHKRVLSELAEERARLAHLALHDPLTSLPNRALLLDRLRHALEAASRRGQLAVLFIDLDHFKEVNDHGGHSAGDQLLIAVAKRLTEVVRPT
ncbi:MAG TPA: GGDEF domain-containing protein, partial [Acidimicrobiales bacterium]|nr:GGDEF domain-containing protein [Acidimicrobiales bacterium]